MSNLGALPGFLFRSMFSTGFFAVAMAGVFGAVTLVFWSAVAGFGTAIDVFDNIMRGAAIGEAIAIVIILVASRTYLNEPVERSKYVSGGA